MRQHLHLAVLLSLLPAAPGWADMPFVAGVVPSERPANAPVVTDFSKSEEWYDAALHGVDKPYPPTLGFLDDQGRWFNPFLKAGMLAPYDIRNWH